MFRRATGILLRLICIPRRTLIVLLVLLVGLLALYVRRVRQQQLAAGAIRQLGGMVAYDYQLAGDMVYVRGHSWVPAGLRQRLGDDFFHSVVYVQVAYRSDAEDRPGPEMTIPRGPDDFLAGRSNCNSVRVRGGPGRSLARRLANSRQHPEPDEGVAHSRGWPSRICLIGTESPMIGPAAGGIAALTISTRENCSQPAPEYAADAAAALWVGIFNKCNPSITDEARALVAAATGSIDLEGMADRERTGTIDRSEPNGCGCEHQGPQLRW
jgi:hypothetical protein